MYFDVIAKKDPHFVQKHIFDGEYAKKIIKYTILRLWKKSTILNSSDELTFRVVQII